MPVVGFDLSFQRVLADGEAFGDVGAYEELGALLDLQSTHCTRLILGSPTSNWLRGMIRDW
jgi:hypothetical protein